MLKEANIQKQFKLISREEIINKFGLTYEQSYKIDQYIQKICEYNISSTVQK